MEIAVIGAGSVGTVLGGALARAGHRVVYGLRTPARELPRCCGGDTVARAAARAEVVFLAVPARAVAEVLEELGDLDGKVLVDCTNPVGWDDGPVVAGSTARYLARATTARVVKGFSTFGAELSEDPRVSGGHAADLHLAGDDEEAKLLVAGLGRELGFRSLDCGPLRNAVLLEHLAVLWIHLATVGGQGRDVAFKLLPVDRTEGGRQLGTGGSGLTTKSV